MEGPTLSGGSRNRLTCLTLQEHDDDDDDDDEHWVAIHSLSPAVLELELASTTFVILTLIKLPQLAPVLPPQFLRIF